MAPMSACFPPSRSPGPGFGDHETRNIEVPLLPRLRPAGQHDAMAVVLGAIAIATGGFARAGPRRAKLVGW
jgi:hypothetical protein